MNQGYVGLRSRRRNRYKLLFIFFILFLGLIVLINIIFQDKVTEIVVEDESFISKEENNTLIKQLESKLLRLEQRIKMRENSIIVFKDQIKVLKDNNKELNSTIEILNLEKEKGTDRLQKNIQLHENNLSEIEKLQDIIINLKKEIKDINDSYISIKTKNNNINNQLDIMENKNKILEIDKNTAIEEIKILKEKIVVLIDKIHHR